MIEIKNKKNPIAGYTGCLPCKQREDDEYTRQRDIDSHIPGYVGYIPSLKAENLFAQTYGKTTENCYKQSYPKGIEHAPEIKYKSTTKDTFVHPNSIKAQQLNEGKINGVKLSTFSNAAKMMMSTTGFHRVQNDKPTTTLTYEQACKRAYQN